MEDNTFHGAIVVNDPNVYQAGGETGIQVKRVITDQTPFLPDFESQRDNIQDFMNCVTFSAMHDIETGINYLLATGQFPQATVDFFNEKGYMQNGKFRGSVRFNAKLNGTTINGNDNKTVGDHFVSDGIVPDSMSLMTSNMTWGEYYAPIPQSLIDLGQEFKKHVTIQYQYALPTLQSISLAPVQIFTAVCSGWSTDNPVKACTAPCQHATLVYALDANGDYLIRDHYNPGNKVLAKDYKIYYSQQFVVSVPVSEVVTPFKYTFTEKLTSGDSASDEVHKLQEALQFLGYMKKGVFGPFGPQTKAALGQFQTDNHITDPDGQGTNFGPKTRAAMNSKLNGTA